jgi:hypothetical protein
MKRDRTITPEQSSKFVEDFSRQCHDNGVTGPGVKIFPKSKLYEKNYDKINWSDNTPRKRGIGLQ